MRASKGVLEDPRRLLCFVPSEERGSQGVDAGCGALAQTLVRARPCYPPALHGDSSSSWRSRDIGSASSFHPGSGGGIKGCGRTARVQNSSGSVAQYYDSSCATSSSLGQPKQGTVPPPSSVLSRTIPPRLALLSLDQMCLTPRTPADSLSLLSAGPNVRQRSPSRRRRRHVRRHEEEEEVQYVPPPPPPSPLSPIFAHPTNPLHAAKKDRKSVV